MDWDTVAGNWKRYKGQVQQRRGRLAGKIQEAYGVGKKEAERQIRRPENRTLNYGA